MPPLKKIIPSKLLSYLQKKKLTFLRKISVNNYKLYEVDQIKLHPLGLTIGEADNLGPNGGEEDEDSAMTNAGDNNKIFVIYGTSPDESSSITPNDLTTTTSFSSATPSLPPSPKLSPTSYKAVIPAQSIMTYRPQGFDDGMKHLLL